MDIQLTPEEAVFREEIREFIRANLTEEMRQGQFLNSGVFPDPKVSRDWWRLLGEKGWTAALWPPEYGGPGWTAIQRFIYELECAEASAPLINPMGIRLAGPVIIKYGTPEQQAKYLPGTRSGEIYWCQGFSEPGAGSDLASLRTRAVRDGDHYVINGGKTWTTHAHFADYMFALVRTSTEGRPHKGISFMVIDMKTPGIEVRPIISMSGEYELNEVFFDNCRVPADCLIGEENAGWSIAKFLLEFERGGGIFSGRLRSSLKRVQMAVAGRQDGALGLTSENPAVAPRLAELAMAVDAFEFLEFQILGQLNPGESPGPMASVLKLRASRLKQEIGRVGMDLLGSQTVRIHENEAEAEADLAEVVRRDFLNARAATIFGGSSEVQLELMGRMLLD